ncbi:hypothetical protein FA95DRAFT_1611232 [Auriscalpium vulgare]|uniref:Uncharacterized protein n=1 Tax=Auriscalpium vulgare TaxID=40419 RepID=A0ACB8RB34_9AGAM|nr:hypothetical protein FA95DRAFT_1611232 [Auriscalpium vulgare]
MYRAVPSGHPQTAPGPSSHGWGSNQSSYPTPGFTTTAAQAHTVNAPHRSQSWQDPQYPHSQAAENDASQEWIPVESKKAKKLRKVDEALATIQSNRLAEQSRYQSRR